jgi:dienelactone hydrolase
MKFNLKIVSFLLVFFYGFTSVENVAVALNYQDYQKALGQSQKITIPGLPQGDGKALDAYLHKPAGDGPYPAIIALHGAGGIFPYQIWWAYEISKYGYAVIFVDHYCTRGHLCEIESDDHDSARGEIMRNWQSVSPRQRVLDAVAAYLWLSRKPYVKNDKIGLIGWSWGGASALFAQKLARRLSLPNGGFKATIAFYPNLKYAIDTPQWTRSGPIEKPTLILYGKSDTLESKESYDSLLSAGYSADIRVLGFKGAYKKFDELGGYREKYHPSIGNFPKAFQKEAFETSIKEIKRFLSQNLQ